MTSDDLRASIRSDAQAAGKELMDRIKLVSAVTGTIMSVVIIAVFAVVGFYVYSHVPILVKEQVHDASEQIQKDLHSQIDPIRDRVTKLELTSDILNKLKTLINSDGEHLKSSLPEVPQLLRTAQAQGIVVDPSEIDQLGERLISIHQKDVDVAPAAWIALNRALDYRSFLNVKVYPDSYYAKITTPRKTDEAFKYDHVPTSIEYKFNGILIENATQDLDWIGFENVIFRNCTIRYSGHPTIIKNVAFQNCIFEFQPEPRAVKVSQELLTSNIVTTSPM